MRQAAPKYHPGIEFYVTPDMGLCGVTNDSGGNQRTAQYLTQDEAVEWLETWLAGAHWKRESTASVSSQEGERP